MGLKNINILNFAITCLESEAFISYARIYIVASECFARYLLTDISAGTLWST